METGTVEARFSIDTAQPAWRGLSQVRPLASAALLLLGDLCSLVLAIWLAVFLWSAWLNPVAIINYFLPGHAVAIYLATYAWGGLYSGLASSPVDELRKVVQGTTLVSLILLTMSFLTGGLGLHSRGVFVSAWLLTMILVPVHRALLRHLLSGRAWWGVPVLVFGAGKTAQMFLHRLRDLPGLGLKPIACLDDDAPGSTCAGIPVAGGISMASHLAHALGVRHAVVAMAEPESQRLLERLEQDDAPFSHVIVIPNLYNLASVWVSAKDFSGVLGLEVRQNLLIPGNRWIKRAIDVLLGGLLAFASLPMVALAAAWIKIVNGGPALYSQLRSGEGGKLIRVWKLRTMYEDAEILLERHLEDNTEARAEWEKYFKLKRDPRILPGPIRLLRLLSLDELPQVWNVLKGEMSLVGPRPFPEYHEEQFSDKFRALRGKVKPGLTGLWQVSARSDGDLQVQEALDTYYIRNWSLWLDLYILSRTTLAVICAKGAY